jgi:hypothetical protein
MCCVARYAFDCISHIKSNETQMVNLTIEQNVVKYNRVYLS